MQTTGSHDVFLDHDPTLGDGGMASGQPAAPAVMVAGSRVTREFVRLLVAMACAIAEAVFQIDELRNTKAFRHKRGL